MVISNSNQMRNGIMSKWVNVKALVIGLFQLTKVVFYINVVLGGAAIGFQILNLIKGTKTVLAPYLGKFSVIVNSPAKLETDSSSVSAFVTKLSGSPELLIDSNIHTFFVLAYTFLIVCIVLVYNYKLLQILNVLSNQLKSAQVFELEIPKYFNQLAIFSTMVFILGSIVSIAKMLLVNNIIVDGITLSPVYDNGLLNFLWAGIVFWILSLVFKVGFSLKQENELTI